VAFNDILQRLKGKDIMPVVSIALRVLPWLIIAFPIVVGMRYGYGRAFFAMLALALLTSTYIVLQDTPDIFSHYKMSQKYSRVEALLRERKVDDLFGVLAGGPVALSVFGGVILFAFHWVTWLIAGTWKPVTVQTIFGSPVTPGDVATGLRGLDKIVWWCLADAPLELWLIVIFPLIWIAMLSLPFVIAKRSRRRRLAASLKT